MTGVSKRTRKDGTVAHRVEWRDGGTRAGRRCWETFDTAVEAKAFAALVDLAGQHEPDGWIHGVGWATLADPDTPPVPTVQEWVTEEIASRTRANARSRADAQRDMVRYLFPRLGVLPITSVDAREAKAWVAWLLTQDIAPKTRKNIHGTVSTSWEAAVQSGIVPRNPFKGLMPPVSAVHVEEMVFLTPQEFRLFLAAVPAHYHPLVLLLALTGVRWGEATALQWSDVDLLRGRLRVVRAWKRPPTGPMELGEPKTRRSRRTISLPIELVDVLVPLSVDTEPGDFVFTTSVGTVVSHNNFYNRVWRPTVARVNDPDLPAAMRLGKRPRIHDLRHSHASWLIDAGVPLPTIQARLGHESITTTVDRYGHLASDADERAAAALPVLLSV